MYRHFFIIILVLIAPKILAQDTINQKDNQGKMHGFYRKYHPNGNLRFEGSFHHGKEIGTFKFYAISGEKLPIAIKQYNPENDSIKVSFYNKAGKLESEGMMLEKKRIGIWRYYFPDGVTLMSTENYKDGVLDGEIKIFYKNGQLTEISHYLNGKYNGNRKRYADNGNLVEDINYKDGILHGSAIFYDSNGIKIAEGNYVNGLKKGEWKFLIDDKWIVTDKPEKIMIKK